MGKNRLFTFGCSCTGYHYPTWADLIGTQFEEFYNSGLAGMGNRFIQQMVFEADYHKKFTPDDTVLVMFTSYLRNDVWLSNGKNWPSRGPVYLTSNADVYNNWWMKNHWSLEWGLMDSWSSVNAVKRFLDASGVQYKLLNAMPLTGDLKEGTSDTDIFEKDMSNFDYSNLLDEVYPVWHMANDYGFTSEDLYTFNIDGKLDNDLHPTIEMYTTFIKEFLPEYYNDNIQKLGNLLHKDLLAIFKRDDLTQENFYENVYNYKSFVDVRGEHIGSIRGL